MLLGIASTWGVDGVFSQVPSFTVSRGPQTFSDLEMPWPTASILLSLLSGKLPYKGPKR